MTGSQIHVPPADRLDDALRELTARAVPGLSAQVVTGDQIVRIRPDRRTGITVTGNATSHDHQQVARAVAGA